MTWQVQSPAGAALFPGRGDLARAVLDYTQAVCITKVPCRLVVTEALPGLPVEVIADYYGPPRYKDRTPRSTEDESLRKDTYDASYWYARGQIDAMLDLGPFDDRQDPDRFAQWRQSEIAAGSRRSMKASWRTWSSMRVKEEQS